MFYPCLCDTHFMHTYGGLTKLLKPILAYQHFRCVHGGTNSNIGRLTSTTLLPASKPKFLWMGTLKSTKGKKENFYQFKVHFAHEYMSPVRIHIWMNILIYIYI
jgi:hypothetical protein